MHGRIGRIFSLIKKLSKCKMKVKDLAAFYGVHESRIYADLKVLGIYTNLKNENSYYWIAKRK